LTTEVPTRSPADPSTQAARETLGEVRQRLAATLTDARATLADLEDDNRRIRRELQLVESSKGRRTLLALKHRVGRALAIAIHPLWTLRTALRHLRNRGAVGTARAMAERLLLRRTALRGIEPAERHSDQPDVADAIRWIGRVRISGETHDALLCHPPSWVRYEASCLGRAVVVARCGMLPNVWPSNQGGVECTLTVATADGWSARQSIRINPRRRWRDRQWRRLSIRLPWDNASSEMTTVQVTLTTALPPGAMIEHAWAVWGDPHLRSWRSRQEILVSLRSVVARVRHFGLRATLEQLRQTEAADLHADLYRRWLMRNAVSESDLQALAADAARLSYTPMISVVTPVYNTDPRWLRACIESIRHQVYPHWELCLCDDGSTLEATRDVLREYESDPRIRVTYLEKNSQISAASNAALATATGEFVALVDHDDELTPDALYRVASYLNEHCDADLIYSDEDKLDLGGARCDPYFKPDWSPEHFLSCNYLCHLVVVRRSLMTEIGGFRLGFEGAQDYDVELRVSERTTHIHHLPRVLYHWRKLPQSTASAGSAKPWALDAGRRSLEDAVRRRAADADVEPGAAHGLFRVRFRIQGEPLVSIVIPTTGKPRRLGMTRVDTLRTVVRSIRQKTSYPRYELVLVADDGEVTEGVRRALEGSAHRIVPYRAEGPFNFSHKMNVGAANAEGSHLLLLNDDVEVIGSDWLTAMLEYSQQPEVGAVGAKLLYPDGRIQHIGIVLGVCGAAGHAFHQHAGASPGYSSSAVSVRNYSAVTAACMMTRRDAFNAVGGFDERLAVDFNDVDYCLRLREAGYRIVFTPFATLYHHESASFGPRTQNAREIELIRQRWGKVIDCDPYYHPELTRDFADYRLKV
jgi:GT2 family glycosyltransferase